MPTETLQRFQKSLNHLKNKLKFQPRSASSRSCGAPQGMSWGCSPLRGRVGTGLTPREYIDVASRLMPRLGRPAARRSRSRGLVGDREPALNALGVRVQPTPSARVARAAPTAVIVSQVPQIASVSKRAKRGAGVGEPPKAARPRVMAAQ
jgi:hypothetical protein